MEGVWFGIKKVKIPDTSSAVDADSDDTTTSRWTTHHWIWMGQPQGRVPCPNFQDCRGSPIYDRYGNVIGFFKYAVEVGDDGFVDGEIGCVIAVSASELVKRGYEIVDSEAA